MGRHNLLLCLCSGCKILLELALPLQLAHLPHVLHVLYYWHIWMRLHMSNTSNYGSTRIVLRCVADMKIARDSETIVMMHAPAELKPQEGAEPCSMVTL